MMLPHLVGGRNVDSDFELAVPFGPPVLAVATRAQ